MMCFKTVVFIVFFCLTAVVESRRPSFGYLAYHPYHFPKPVTSQTETAIENDVSEDTLGKEILGDKVTKLELVALTKNFNDDDEFNNEPTPLSAAIGEENEINDDI